MVLPLKAPHEVQGKSFDHELTGLNPGHAELMILPGVPQRVEAGTSQADPLLFGVQ